MERLRNFMMWVGVLALVLVFSGALVAWAAVYRYGGGTTTLSYAPSGGYTCPSSDQDVNLRYGVDGSTIWDSYGTVEFRGLFRNYAGGPVHSHSYSPIGSIDFDQNYRGWDTGHQYAVEVLADPSGLSSLAPMELAIYCQ